jgi:hypothetical protein
VAALVVIGLCALFVFVVRYGGLSVVTRNISAIRSGHVERDTLGAVARMFTIFIDFAAWMSFAMLIQRKSRWVVRDVAMWGLFAGLALLSLGNGLIGGGRGALVFPLVMYYLTYLYLRGRPPIRYSISLGAVIVFVVLVGKAAIFQAAFLGPLGVTAGVIEYAGGMGALDVAAEVSREFSHVYISLRQAIESAGDSIDLRWFVDIPLGILFYLRVFGIEVPDTISYLNTLLTTGIQESDIPPGIVGMWWYSAMLPGVVTGAFCYGVIGRLLESVLRGLCQRSYGVPLFIYFSFMYGSFSFNGDLRVYVMKLFPLGVFLSILILGSLGSSGGWRTRSTSQEGRPVGIARTRVTR